MTEILSNSFLTALEKTPTFTPVALTENGALSNAIVDPTDEYEGRLGLFYKSVRGVDKDTLSKYLTKALKENRTDTIILAYHIRDCRGGKGERDLGRNALLKVFTYLWDLHNNPPLSLININIQEYIELYRELLCQLADYGRWDDLIWIYGNWNKAESNERPRHMIFDLIRQRLESDLQSFKSNTPCSLCAKWLPTEKHKLDRETNFVSEFCKYTKISPKKYRKEFIVPLRKYIDIVERNICSGNWNIINYSTVPSCTMQKLKKAFAKHDPERFNEWVSQLESGKTKVNSTQLFPHQLVHEYMSNNCQFDRLLEAQWRNFVDQARQSGTFENSLVVCDVSGSMMFGCGSNIDGQSAPINICLALGVLISQVIAPPFNGKVITFSNKPQYVDLSQELTLSNKLNFLKRAHWGMNTDFQKIFDLILTTAQANKIPESQMPKRLYVISDMQFDQASSKNDKTNFDVIRNKYSNHGYQLPEIVFWNVNGKCTDFPITRFDHGLLVSGFSPSVLNFIYKNGDCTPVGLLKTVINDSRYKPILTICHKYV